MVVRRRKISIAAARAKVVQTCVLCISMTFCLTGLDLKKPSIDALVATQLSSLSMVLRLVLDVGISLPKAWS